MAALAAAGKDHESVRSQLSTQLAEERRRALAVNAEKVAAVQELQAEVRLPLRRVVGDSLVAAADIVDDSVWVLFMFVSGRSTPTPKPSWSS